MTRQREYWKMWGAMIALLLLIIIATALGGCSKTAYVPVQTASLRTDTVERTIRIHTSDTIREKEYLSDFRYDSVAPILDSLNRVIGWDRYHFRETTKMGERERMSLLAQIDSLKQTRIDSVYIEKPVTVEKVVQAERKRHWWETALLWAAGIAIAATAVTVIRRYRR